MRTIRTCLLKNVSYFQRYVQSTPEIETSSVFGQITLVPFPNSSDFGQKFVSEIQMNRPNQTILFGLLHKNPNRTAKILSSPKPLKSERAKNQTGKILDFGVFPFSDVHCIYVCRMNSFFLSECQNVRIYNIPIYLLILILSIYTNLYFNSILYFYYSITSHLLQQPTQHIHLLHFILSAYILLYFNSIFFIT